MRLAKYMKTMLAAVLGVAGMAATGEELVVVCPITGMIDQGMAVVVERAVRDANERKAAVALFRIDTPGGRVDSAIEIASAIQDCKATTVAYIEGMGAISAGALISFACDYIVMEPGSAMGAAAPVTISTGGLEPLGEKEISFVRAKMRAETEAPREAVHAEAFNVVPPEENYRIRELAEIVGETVPGCEVTLAAGAGPDPRNYRVSGAKLQALFPQFEYRWNARLGARELADAYRAAGLDRGTFEGPRFKRLGWIRKLLAEGTLASDLRWSSAPAAAPAPPSVNYCRWPLRPPASSAMARKSSCRSTRFAWATF